MLLSPRYMFVVSPFGLPYTLNSSRRYLGSISKCPKDPARGGATTATPYIRPYKQSTGPSAVQTMEERFKKNVNFHPRIYMEHIGIGRVLILRGNIEERACELATYIIENRTTVREAARRFGISKSTVHMDGVK